MRLVRRAAAGLLLVVGGLALSPTAVPVYDGIGQPDEPYRYVERPDGAPVTAEPTTGRGTSPVVAGLAAYGMNVATQEVAPQFSLFLPPRALRVPGARAVEVTATPQATVTDPPSGLRADGNSYVVAFSVPGVTLTRFAALATITMRATSSEQPAPTIYYRPAAGEPWQALKTARAGTEIYAASFPGPGQFQVVFPAAAEDERSVLPVVLVGLVVALAVVVVVIRLRAAPTDA